MTGASSGQPPADLAALQRRLEVHELLLRALLTHVALRDPEAFEALVTGFANSGGYGSGGPERDAAEALTALIEDVARSVNR